jgi:copper(I)-binding protein
MRVVGLLVFALTLGAALAVSAGGQDMMVERAVAGATHKGAKAGAGYLTITNHGDTADRLLAVEAGFDRVMLHTTEMTDGVAKMVHLGDGIEIAAGGTVMMAPGGMHVMFMGLGGYPFEAGEEFPAVLIFEKAGRVEVSFAVVPLTELKMKMSHDAHD